MSFVANGRGECVQCQTAVLDVGISEHGCENFHGNGTKVLVVRAIGRGENVTEGENGNRAHRGGTVAEQALSCC